MLSKNESVSFEKALSSECEAFLASNDFGRSKSFLRSEGMRDILSTKNNMHIVLFEQEHMEQGFKMHMLS